MKKTIDRDKIQEQLIELKEILQEYEELNKINRDFNFRIRGVIDHIEILDGLLNERDLIKEWRIALLEDTKVSLPYMKEKSESSDKEIKNSINKAIDNVDMAYKIKDKEGNIFVFGGIENGFPWYRGLGGSKHIFQLDGYEVVEKYINEKETTEIDKIIKETNINNVKPVFGKKYFQLFKYANNSVGGEFLFCTSDEIEENKELFKPDEIEEISHVLYEKEKEREHSKFMRLMTDYPKNEYEIDINYVEIEDEWDIEI